MNWLYTFWSKLSIAAGDFADYTEIEDIYNTIMVIVCVVCAGLAAGLTMGMLSFDETKLEVKTISGTENERVAAEAILPLIKQHHLLLVTLLLFNSLANETLPIFLGALVPNYIAIILSVTLVLIFGEIIPSAFFTGPNQLLTAAKMTKLVYFLMFIFWPIAYPLGKLLDHIFGVEEDHGSLSRSELEALVTLQDSNRLRVKSTGNLDVDELMKMPNSSESCNHSESRGLSQYEINVMTGILQSPKVNAGTSLIKTKDVFMLSSSSILNDKCLCDIRDVGYSRIPVYRRKDRQHILGYLLVKDLIVINPKDNVMIEELRIRPPLIARPSTGLLEMLGLFQEAEIHMAFISEDPAETRKCIENRKRPSGSAVVLGVLTLEDVLEKILQYDIFDESDLTRRQTKNGTMTSTQLLRQSSGRVRRPSLSQISSLHVDDTSTPAEANNLKQNEECDENTELLNGKLRQSYSENKIENLRKLGNTNNLHQVDEIDLENNRYRTGSVDDNFIDDCNSLLSKSQQIIGSRSITGNRLDIENTDYSKMINRN